MTMLAETSGDMGAPSALRERSVLVTGASGFIGSHLCARLLREGARVHAVSRKGRAGSAISWHQADLCSADGVAQLLDRTRPELIFHLASYVAGTREPQAVLPMLNANCVAAVNMLAHATERRVARVVLAGSLEEPDGDAPPSSPYAAAKWATSGYARMFHALYAAPVVTARIYMTYGPDQPDHNKLLPHVALQLARGESPLLSSGRRRVDWIYVDDLVAGLIALAVVPGLEGATLDLGSGKLVPIADVVRELYAIAAPESAPRFGTLPDRPLEIERVAQLAETTQRTGWQPRVGLEEGLRRTYAHYRAVARGEDVVNAIGLRASRT